MDGMGERIKAARLERRESQDKLARRAKVPQSSLSAVERGLKGLTAWDTKRLAAALGCTVAWLQTGVDDSSLCAEVATIPVAQIHFLAQVARRHGEEATADKVEAWLRDAVGDSIPF